MHVRKIILPAALIFITQCCLGQFTDDCSDGELAANPSWTGDQTKFIVSSGKMKLQAPAISGEAFLSTPSQAIHNASWEFYLQMDFTPSSSNYAKIYLVSDEQFLGGALNGYFIKAGNTSKEISLYRQIGTSELEIIDGLDDRLNIATAKVKIKVTRNDAGEWQLYSDVGLTGSYAQEGTIKDNTHTSSAFFGLECIYTSTRSDKFWFDDIVVSGVPVPDVTPPVIQIVSAMDQHQVSLLFSEEVDPGSSITPANYQLISVGAPDHVSLQPDHRTVWLIFNSGFSNGVKYSMRVSGVKDLAGNIMANANVEVLFFKPVLPKRKDIIFTEIFPDPSPQIALPGAEFVEIYNRSTDAFDLKGWNLSDGGSAAVFPAQIILPGEYWIITSSSSASLYNALGKTIGLVNFPTLNNAGESLRLTDPDQGTIDSVTYSLAEYHDADKSEGGWTLELIDPNQPCGEQENWTSSEDGRGGTPGQQNSVLANKPDLTAPFLVSFFPETPTQITLFFNEKLDPASLSASHFSVGEQKARQAFFKDLSKRIIVIELQDSLATRHSYLVDVKGIRDCSGNEGVDFQISLGLPEKSDSLDLVINEILFNPRSGGSDFVEVYNRSEKYLDLKNWKLCSVEEGVPANVVGLFAEHMLLAPGDFSVFTPDPQMVKLHYPQSIEQKLWNANLPVLPDDRGSVGVMDEQGQLLDALAYSKEWHSPFIKDDEGISLERISANASTNRSDNWTSASSRAGFATPGFSNSQHINMAAATREGEVIIAPEIFSPAGSGQDFVEIRYNLEQAGWVANVKIIDHGGHQLKTVANNETLGPQGFFRWDGDLENGNLARSGYYVVWFELFNSAGEVKTFRKRVVVAAR